MRSVLSIITGLLLVVFIVSCSSGASNEKYPYGKYSFQSFTFYGELIGEGSLYIHKTDSISIEGNWSIRDIKNCSACGPQFGGGFLIGWIEGDSVYINLNPDTPENYVELVGNFNGNSFSGEWRWFEMIVNSNRGTFKSIKE